MEYTGAAAVAHRIALMVVKVAEVRLERGRRESGRAEHSYEKKRALMERTN
jgi:hypothetical protein